MTTYNGFLSYKFTDNTFNDIILDDYLVHKHINTIYAIVYSDIIVAIIVIITI